MKDRVDKNLVKENDNIRKYMQQIKVDLSLLWTRFYIDGIIRL